MKQERLSKYLLYIWVAASVTLPGYAAGPKRDPNASRGGAIQPAEGGALTLARAIRLALENNPDLHASAARKEAAAVDAMRSRGDALPSRLPDAPGGVLVAGR